MSTSEPLKSAAEAVYVGAKDIMWRTSKALWESQRLIGNPEKYGILQEDGDADGRNERGQPRRPPERTVGDALDAKARTAQARSGRPIPRDKSCQLGMNFESSDTREADKGPHEDLRMRKVVMRSSRRPSCIRAR